MAPMITTADLRKVEAAKMAQGDPTPSKVTVITTKDLIASTKRKEDFEDVQHLLRASSNRYLKHLVADQCLAEAPVVVVIGGGPSVKTVDLDGLEGAVVVGVNRGFELDQVGINVSMDLRFKRWMFNGGYKDLSPDILDTWKNWLGVKVFAVLQETPVPENGEDPPYVVYRRQDPNFGIERSNTEEMCNSTNSGQAAIQLALALGAKNVHLIGFDMNPSENGQEQEWYHNGHPENQGAHVYDRMVDTMVAPAKFARNNGVEILNHSQGSAISSFNIAKSGAEWNEMTATIPKRPVVVSYFTDELYHDHCKEMAQTAHFFGMSTCLYSMESLGSWIRNCSLKPMVIAKAMEEFPDDPILFVDADSRFRTYPTLFDNHKGHFGYCTFDWPKWTNGQRDDKEISSAVLYIKNVAITRKLVATWKDACERNLSDGVDVWDQKVLAHIIRSMKWHNKEKVFDIPPAYCQIFDTMAHLGAPVIEQMQASREARVRSS